MTCKIGAVGATFVIFIGLILRVRQLVRTTHTLPLLTGVLDAEALDLGFARSAGDVRR